MYTKEDFFRDYPPPKEYRFAFPWEQELHERELKRVRDEAEEKIRLAEERAKQSAEEKARLAEEKIRLAEENAKLAEYTEERGKLRGKIDLFKEQLSQGVISEAYYNAVLPELERKLEALEREKPQTLS